MRFYQITACYEGYLDAFYRAHPEALDLPYAEHLRLLAGDGFGSGHLIAPYMEERGYETGYAIVNCRPLQESWCREMGVPFPAWPQGLSDVAQLQVEAFAPDVLHLLDPISFDSAFVRRLARRPGLVLGWRAARIPEWVDWREFDVVLSSCRHCLRQADERGARRTVYSHPGFAPHLAQAVRDVPHEHDVVFCGSFTPEHAARNRLLTEIAKAPLGLRDPFSPAFHLFTPKNPGARPAGVAMHDLGPRWGLDMYRALGSGRVVVNAAIDMADSEAPNMRLFEATGCGAFLLTERQFNLEAFFTPGEEVETFADSAELLDKISYYLAHPAERAAIAARGQARCLGDYAMPVRARSLDRIIRDLLPIASPADGDAASLTRQAVRQAEQGRFPEARDLLDRAVILGGEDIFGHGYCQALLHQGAGDPASAFQAARNEVLSHPDNDSARQLLSSLMLQGCAPEE